MMLRHLYIGCSVAAISAVSLLGIVPANAQAAGDNSPSVETVTVTGSRISIQGYEQPTPVTVISAADLDRDAYTDLDQSLVQLPAVGISGTLSNGVGAICGRCATRHHVNPRYQFGWEQVEVDAALEKV